MLNFKSFEEPIRKKVVIPFENHLATGKNDTKYAGREEGDELLIISSFTKELKPFFVVYDEIEETSYTLFATFLENPKELFDYPEVLDFELG